MLDQHIEYLIQEDKYFYDFWARLKSKQKKKFIAKYNYIDKLYGHTNAFENQCKTAGLILKKKYLQIPSSVFEFAKIPKDWRTFIRNDNEKRKIFIESEDTLKRFLERHRLNNKVELYGNIKEISSLERKIHRKEKLYTYREEIKIFDIWDIIRFRIVVNNDKLLISVGVLIWQDYLEKIIKCRNFYFHPKNSNIIDPYRGIHYLLEIVPNRIIEIQLVSKEREGMIYLDHSVLFKKIVKPINKSHLKWLFHLSLKINLFEAKIIDI